MASSPASSPASRRSRSVSPTTATTRLIMQSRMNALSDDSSDGDDEILRPRGRMAARMLAQTTKRQQESSEEEDEAPTTTRAASPKQTSNDTENNHNDSDDEVRPARPRKLVPRRQRSPTPNTAPPAAASSPGLFISPQKDDGPGSPGLFVSPSKPQSHSGHQSDDGDDNEMPSIKNPRFKALVERKRQERLAREAEEARKQAERRKAMEESMMDVDNGDNDDEDHITDDEGGHRLTQEAAATTARAPRKASKKALEEMNRETQRLARSLQLAHEAKVRKKITKATLFERFNFKPDGASDNKLAPAADPAPSSSRPPTPGSGRQSDVEMKDDDTPPSSPPSADEDGKAEKAAASTEPAVETTAENAATSKLDKGKGKATDAEVDNQTKPGLPSQKRKLRVKLPSIPVHTATTTTLNLDDDDDDLQVVPTRKSKIDAIFDRVPANQAKESHAFQRLRRLANLDDPDRLPAPPTRAASSKLGSVQHHDVVMTPAELQATLLQRARQQARMERDRQIEELRAKGIHVQTAEEREREMQEVEDIVARARKEAEEIMAREREDAKAERRRKKRLGEEDEEDPLGWDDSEEEDEEEVEEQEIELSGSEEEEEGEGEEEEDADEDKMVDDAAESVEGDGESESAEAEEADDESSDEHLPGPKKARRRMRKQVTIVTDDEDEAAEPTVKATPQPKARVPQSPSARNAPDSPSVPTSVLRSATKTFIPGLPVAGPAGLGLTQIFAGTMDDSQMGPGTAPASPSQPRPTFDVTAFPDSNFSQTAEEVGRDDMILDSQPQRETQQAETHGGVQLGFSQSQVHGFESFLQQSQSLTQTSELIQPTQDEGFHNFSPLRQRFVDSTVDTVPASRAQQDENSESPLVRRTGKLRRKADLAAVPASPSRRPAAGAADDEESEGAETDEFGFGTKKGDAFAAMKEAARKEKKRKEAFDKKKSKAREMVEEQAEESEDEYAGLGGADGEDSEEDEDDQSVKDIIDDETKADQDDERKLAAFYADRERAADEKQVEKLFHDITTGMLRRKRTGNWDELSDEDDGGEARRRMKRRQFAKMQRALFADERISKVAENPRNQAFLRTIEDVGSDDDMDFIFAPPPPPPGLESQGSTSGQSAVIPNSQPQAAGDAGAAPAAGKNPRRTAVGGRKPANLSEIRESLSNLLDEPFNTSSSVIPATEFGSSDEEDEADKDEATRPQSSHSTGSTSSNKENLNPRRVNPRRPGAKHAPATEIVDRISLKRNASTSTLTSAQGKLAFAAASSSGPKVPALLRRATTNSSLLSTSGTSSSSSSGTTTPSTTGAGVGGKADDGMRIRKPVGKRSGISYLARETERRAALAEAERRREEKKVKGAEGRVKIVGGLFGRGEFE